MECLKNPVAFPRKILCFSSIIIILCFLAACGGNSDSSSETNINIENLWTGSSTSSISGQSTAITLSLKKDGLTISGTYTCRGITGPCLHKKGSLSGNFSGNTLDFSLSFPDGQVCEEFKGTLNGNNISGVYSCLDTQKDDSGSWSVNAPSNCFGVEFFGLCLKVEFIDPIEEDTFSSRVDTFFSQDCNGDGIENDPEPAFAHRAEIGISNILIPGSTIPPSPEFVTFTNYSIEYFTSPNNLGSAPDLDGWTFSAKNLFLETGSIFLEEFELVPLQTKLQYATLGGDTLPQSYTAVYSFSGISQFNEDVVLQGTVSFAMGNFNNCS